MFFLVIGSFSRLLCLPILMCCLVFSPQTRGLQNEMKSRRPDVTKVFFTSTQHWKQQFPRLYFSLWYLTKYCKESEAFYWICSEMLSVSKTHKVRFCANPGNSTGFFCSKTGIKAWLDFTKVLTRCQHQQHKLCATLHTIHLAVSCGALDSRPELSRNSLRFYHVAQLWSERIRFCGFSSDYTTMKWSDLAHKKNDICQSQSGLWRFVGSQWNRFNVLLWQHSGHPRGFSWKNFGPNILSFFFFLSVSEMCC